MGLERVAAEPALGDGSKPARGQDVCDQSHGRAEFFALP
jgi:hypothetical protein